MRPTSHTISNWSWASVLPMSPTLQRAGRGEGEQGQLAHARRCRQHSTEPIASPFISGCVSEHKIHSTFRVCRRRDAVEVGRSLSRRARAWNYSSQQTPDRPCLLVGGPEPRPPLLPPPDSA